VSTKENPYCCVSADGHIWHHCVHRTLEEEIEKAKKRIEALSPEKKQKLKDLIQEILNEN
jgi:hypothetical protein